MLQRAHPLARSEAGQPGRRISRAQADGLRTSSSRLAARLPDAAVEVGPGSVTKVLRPVADSWRTPGSSSCATGPVETGGDGGAERDVGEVRVSAPDGGSPRIQSFRATSGPVIRLRSGNVEAMIASDAASPPRTVAQ